MFEVYFIYWKGAAYQRSYETLAEAIAYCKTKEEELACEKSFQVWHNDELVYES